MFFFLSKVLLFLISPFFWLVIGVIVLFRTKRERLKRRLKIAIPVFFFFFTNTVILLEFMRSWEIPGTKLTQVTHHKVAVVLGGMFEYDSQMERLSIRRGGDRIIQTLSLYKAGKIDRILISGDNGHLSDRGLHEARQTKALLISWGVPDSVILADTISKNTHENAQYTAEILKKNKLDKDVLLVTSGIHMRRAMACFEKQNIHVTPFSTDLYTGKRRGYHWDQYIIPNPYNFIIWNELLKEFVGYVTYDFAGYI